MASEINYLHHNVDTTTITHRSSKVNTHTHTREFYLKKLREQSPRLPHKAGAWRPCKVAHHHSTRLAISITTCRPHTKQIHEKWNEFTEQPRKPIRSIYLHILYIANRKKRYTADTRVLHSWYAIRRTDATISYGDIFSKNFLRLREWYWAEQLTSNRFIAESPNSSTNRLNNAHEAQRNRSFASSSLIRALGRFNWLSSSAVWQSTSSSRRPGRRADRCTPTTPCTWRRWWSRQSPAPTWRRAPVRRRISTGRWSPTTGPYFGSCSCSTPAAPAASRTRNTVNGERRHLGNDGAINKTEYTTAGVLTRMHACVRIRPDQVRFFSQMAGGPANWLDTSARRNVRAVGLF